MVANGLLKSNSSEETGLFFFPSFFSSHSENGVTRVISWTHFSALSYNFEKQFGNVKCYKCKKLLSKAQTKDKQPYLHGKEKRVNYHFINV